MGLPDVEWLTLWQIVVLYVIISGFFTWVICGLFEKQSQAERDAEDNERTEALSRPNEAKRERRNQKSWRL